MTPLEQLKQLRERAAKKSEYCNGYNSGSHIAGRLEGIDLCIQMLENGHVPPGQWSYRPWPEKSA